MLPLPFGIFLGEVFHELKGALLDTVGLGDVDVLAVVLAGGRFETDVAATVIAHFATLAANGEPFIGVVDTNGVQAVGVKFVEESSVVAHEPDHELAA